MHPNAILHEVQQLHSVTDRLDSLAGATSPRLRSTPHHFRVRNAAALLEVLVATKIVPISGLDPASA